MPDFNVARDATLTDTVERLRAERFPHLDRQLVLKILRLHANGAAIDNLPRAIDELLSRRLGKAS